MDTLGTPLLLFEMQIMRQRETRIKTSGEHLGVLSHLQTCNVPSVILATCEFVPLLTFLFY